MGWESGLMGGMGLLLLPTTVNCLAGDCAGQRQDKGRMTLKA